MPVNHALKKNISNDIVIKLKPREGGPKNTKGVTESRLMFDAGNLLHAKMNTQTCLWRLEYDNGILPLTFRQQFTSFPRLLEHVKGYFDRRNIDIVEIID